MMINIYKYNSVRACALVLADMAVEIGDLRNGVIVPLPTISKHIRERGFDHTKVLARRMAALSGARWKELLRRLNNSVQVGANEEMRKLQAGSAYAINATLDKGTRIVLLDDVWTTGSSMLAACELLRNAGYKKIDVMILAKSGKD